MTYREIAEKCGVSISTVSRALNGKPGVNEELRGRIFEEAERCKALSPVTVGRRRGKKAGKKYVAIIMGANQAAFFSEILASMHDALRDHGYSMGMFNIEDGEDELDFAATIDKEDRLAGIVLLGGRYDYTEENIRKISVPFVMCGYTNRSGSLDSDRYSSVFCDDYMSSYSAVEVLVRAGHRRIAALFPSVSDRSVSELRYNGFCAALEDNGIELDRELIAETGGTDPESSYRSTLKLIRKNRDITAIYTANDIIGIAALKALWDSGIAVPDKMSLISIDGVGITEYSVPQLTTMAQPRAELGRRCIEQLMELIRGGSNRQIVLETCLRSGGTLKKNRK